MRFPGLAVAVLRNGEVAAIRTWGVAEVAKKVTLTKTGEIAQVLWW